MDGDERRLIQRAKAGDPTAFAEIFDRHQPAIYRYIFFRVGDVATAEDLTSDVFVRLVEKIDRFTYQCRPLLAWLYTIARNLVTDHLRRVGQTTILPPYKQAVTDTGNPEQAVEWNLTQRQLVVALGYLTEDQRQAIILKFVEELSNAQVAQMLGKSVGAVKSLQHRALAAMRRTIEDMGAYGNED